MWKVFRIGTGFSIKHLVLILCAIAIFLRSMNYLTESDGDWVRNDYIEPWGYLSWYIYYPCIISSYTCELFIWIELYTTTTYQRIEMLPKLKWVFLIINAIIFPIEIAYRITASFIINTSLESVWYIYLGTVALGEIIGFCIVGTLLLKRVRKMNSVTPIIKKMFIKITVMTFATTALALVCLVLLCLFGILPSINSVWMWYVLDVIDRIVELLLVWLMVFNIQPPPATKTSASEDIEMHKENKEVSGYSFSES